MEDHLLIYFDFRSISSVELVQINHDGCDHTRHRAYNKWEGPGAQYGLTWEDEKRRLLGNKHQGLQWVGDLLSEVEMRGSEKDVPPN